MRSVVTTSGLSTPNAMRRFPVGLDGIDGGVEQYGLVASGKAPSKGPPKCIGEGGGFCDCVLANINPRRNGGGL